MTSGETVSHLRAVSEGGVLGGRVAGSLLAAIRTGLPATQEELAERVGVSATTVQAWERGRKPLVNMPFARLRTLRRDLEAAGANPSLLTLWDRALDADVVLAGLGTTDPGRHPLAMVVPDRAMTGLLAWPLSGQPPRQLAGARADLAAGSGEIAAVTAALREAADRAGDDEERPAMLRGQARFLLALADDPAARAVGRQHRDPRPPRTGRPATVDPTLDGRPLGRARRRHRRRPGPAAPLHRPGPDRRPPDQREPQLLGVLGREGPALWNADSAMTRPAASTWDGTLLLGTLLRGIVHAPVPGPVRPHPMGTPAPATAPAHEPSAAPLDQVSGIPRAPGRSPGALRPPAPRTSQLPHEERMTTPGPPSG